MPRNHADDRFVGMFNPNASRKPNEMTQRNVSPKALILMLGKRSIGSPVPYYREQFNTSIVLSIRIANSQVLHELMLAMATENR